MICSTVQKRDRRRSLILLSLLLGGRLALYGQVSSRISGFVKDSSGAIIPNAVVKAVSAEQGLSRTTQTDTTGYYELLAMPAGTYEIDVESPGFERQVQTGVTLQMSQNLRLDAMLSPSAVHDLGSRPPYDEMGI